MQNGKVTGLPTTCMRLDGKHFTLNRTRPRIKHANFADRYLAELAYRFNRRFNLADMVTRLLRVGATKKPQPKHAQDVRGRVLNQHPYSSRPPCNVGHSLDMGLQ
jgi:hypothetical protein